MNDIKKIVNKVIKKEARQEALDILEIAPQERIDEFIKYYNEHKENVCCMVLDFAKINLIKENKMVKKESDFFGYSFGSEDFI